MSENKKAGFTIIEFLIVLVISVVLVVIFSVRRQSQIRVAYLREADILITDIVNKETMVRMIKNEGVFYDVTVPTGYSEIGGIGGESVDARRYLYFDKFTITDADENSFIITVYGKDRGPAAGVTYKTKYESGVLTPILD